MAATVVVNREGLREGGTDNRELFLINYAGDVISAFREATLFMPLHDVRQSSSGKAIQFPISGRTTAHYHTPGNWLNGDSAIAHNQRTINADELLITDTWIAEIDEIMNHVSWANEYAQQHGFALAKTMDMNIAVVLLLAARSTGNLTTLPGGTTITLANIDTDGMALASAMFQAAGVLDLNSVPTTGRHMAVTPAMFYSLVENTDNINTNWKGQGSYADGTITKITDIAIHKSINLPNGDVVAAVPGQMNDYTGDFTLTRGIIWHESAAGTALWRGIESRMSGADTAANTYATLLTSSVFCGHGILRPESAVELTIPAPTP